MIEFGRPGWQQKSLCFLKGKSPDFFVPAKDDSYEKIGRAVKFCHSGCSQVEQCLKWGKDTNSTGVYGGMYLIKGVPTKLPAEKISA